MEGDGQEDAAYIRFDILHTYPLLLTVSFHLYYKFKPVRDEIEIEFPTDINYWLENQLCLSNPRGRVSSLIARHALKPQEKGKYVVRFCVSPAAGIKENDRRMLGGMLTRKQLDRLGTDLGGDEFYRRDLWSSLGIHRSADRAISNSLRLKMT